MTHGQNQLVEQLPNRTRKVSALAEMTKTSIHTNGEGTRAPLQLSGALDDKYNSFPVTPTIGTEFPATSVRDLLTAKNSDDLLRDLAITGKIDILYKTFG